MSRTIQNKMFENNVRVNEVFSIGERGVCVPREKRWRPHKALSVRALGFCTERDGTDGESVRSVQ